MKISKKSKEILEILIRKEFDSIDLNLDYIFKKSEKLLKVTEEIGLKRLRKEMKNDLKNHKKR